jgi:fatty acid desaturase
MRKITITEHKSPCSISLITKFLYFGFGLVLVLAWFGFGLVLVLVLAWFGLVWLSLHLFGFF